MGEANGGSGGGGGGWGGLWDIGTSFIGMAKGVGWSSSKGLPHAVFFTSSKVDDGWGRSTMGMTNGGGGGGWGGLGDIEADWGGLGDIGADWGGLGDIGDIGADWGGLGNIGDIGADWSGLGDNGGRDWIASSLFSR